MYPPDNRLSTFKLRRAHYLASREEHFRNLKREELKPEEEQTVSSTPAEE